MRYVAQGQTIGCALPLLELFTVFDGFQKEAVSVEFSIHDADGAQTFPGAGREVVDLNDCPAGARRGVGHYLAVWSVSSTEPLGRHEIRWFYKETATSAEQTLVRKFEVLETVSDPLAPAYASIAEMRDDGITEEAVSDTRLLRLLQLASRRVEQFTGRHFDPRSLTLFFDGSGGRSQLLDQPIIAIETVALDASAFEGGELLIEPDLFLVFNRHLSQGLLHPDDRNNPKIEFVHGRDLFSRGRLDIIEGLTLTRLAFPVGPQNVRISGVFGYTDADGSTLGDTPVLLQHATKLLVLRDLPGITDCDGREDAQRRWRLLSEKTSEQSYRLADLSGREGSSHVAVGSFTGDPEIDTLLVQYMRPPAMGSA